MPDPIPAEAVQAAANAVAAHPWNSYPKAAHQDHTFDSACAVCDADLEPMMRAGLEAAAPLLAAQVRRETAEQIRSLARWEMRDGFGDLFDFIERHKRLDQVSITDAAMILDALADEIENPPAPQMGEA